MYNNYEERIAALKGEIARLSEHQGGMEKKLQEFRGNIVIISSSSSSSSSSSNNDNISFIYVYDYYYYCYDCSLHETPTPLSSGVTTCLTLPV